MSLIDRRQFLSAGAMATAALLNAAPNPESFDFIFFTDTHIQPELAAAKGCEMCFEKIRLLKADFAMQGGDHVFDVLAVDRKRAQMLFDMYAKTEHAVEMPIHHAIGNHDVFGINPASGVGVNDAGYGKRMFEDRVGHATFYSLDHKGYHFVVLDSIQPTRDRAWEARIDAGQLEWLKADLQRTGSDVPVIVTVHVPLVTGAASYVAPPKHTNQGYQTSYVSNAFEVLPLFEKHNVLGVLQGHTHINEVVEWKGIPYISCGAVSGNWWHGVRLGTPEGFTLVQLRDDKMTWRYETYGFRSVDPQNT